ncbi:MAG TPA: Crp/Fnr family transcriptional regulator [Stellaceae bacterium]|nr:Crp/Fnr family transcriptional regulator [Stellaceae bacterium]
MTVLTRPDPSQPRNRLLAALPAAELKRLRAHLEPVELPLRAIISPRDAIITHAYFVESGLVSLVQPLSDGAAVEVGLIGREGFIGTPVMLGARSSSAEANIQLKGSGFRIATEALQDAAAEKNSRLRPLLLSFTQALHAQVMQTAACNGRHELAQRLARWLLSAGDRAESHELPLRHEFLSMMLGRRRAGVTVALGKMKQAGLIENSLGRIVIRDRRGMEKAACECYRVVRDEYRRLLP